MFFKYFYEQLPITSPIQALKNSFEKSEPGNNISDPWFLQSLFYILCFISLFHHYKANVQHW